MLKLLGRLRHDDSASTLIETAFIAPLLVTMTLGGVEISSIVAKQTEMQSIAANAMEIIFAAAPETDEDVTQTIADVKAYVASTSGLTATSAVPNAGEVGVYKRWRCGNNSERQSIKGCANVSQTESEFLVIHLKQTYSPVWTEFGLGKDLTFNVKRSVQIG